MRIVLATALHCTELAETMRDEDRAEVWAASRQTPSQALKESFYLAQESGEPLHTILDDEGCVVAVGGVTPPSEDMWGCAWLLASNRLTPKNVRKFRELSIDVTQIWWDRGYVGFTNWVDRRNVLHIKWLESIGAVFGNVERRGVGGEEFIQFFIHKDDCYV